MTNSFKLLLLINILILEKNKINILYLINKNKFLLFFDINFFYF